jgi:hypothetical protein
VFTDAVVTLQFSGQIIIVVEFPIVGDHNTPTSGMKWLGSGIREITHRKAPMPQADTRLNPSSGAVRSAMSKVFGHPI